MAPKHAARTLALDHLWRSVVRAEGVGAGASAQQPGGPLTVAADDAFAAFARAARSDVMALDEAPSNDAVARAIRDVPRERFVPVLALPDAHLDRALPLDDDGLATISAMHAYVATFRALELGPGDTLVDLGGGSGYGAALAAAVVGPRGRVTSIEIDPALVERATRALEGLACGADVRMLAHDAHDVAIWAGAAKVSVGFDVGVLPDAWAQALAPGGRLVAPVAGRLVVVDKAADGTITCRSLGPVVYVRDRSKRSEIERREPAVVRVLETDAPSPGAE
jgi:protein-L-isoaspartate(D-aspartate) O-methyltransferase